MLTGAGSPGWLSTGANSAASTSIATGDQNLLSSDPASWQAYRERLEQTAARFRAV